MPEITHTASFTKAIAFEPMVAVQSSQIVALQYSPEASIMRVQFNGGVTYLYFGVPSEVFHEGRSATSTGQWLNTQIKGKYAYLKEGVAA